METGNKMVTRKTSDTVMPDFKRVSTGLGTKLVWDEDGYTFEGVYLGAGETVMPPGHEQEGELAPYLKFEDDNGRSYFSWRTNELKVAFESIEVDSTIRIVYLGSEDLKGRTGRVKHFDVFVAS